MAAIVGVTSRKHGISSGQDGRTGGTLGHTLYSVHICRHPHAPLFPGLLQGAKCPSYSSSGSPTSSLEHQLLFLSPSSHVGRKAGAPSHWAKGCRLAMHLSGRGTNSDKAAANHRTIYGAWKRLLSFPLALKPHSEAQRTITVRHIIFEYKGQQSVRQSAVQSDFLVGNISTLLFFSLCDNFVISSSRG